MGRFSAKNPVPVGKTEKNIEQSQELKEININVDGVVVLVTS